MCLHCLLSCKHQLYQGQACSHRPSEDMAPFPVLLPHFLGGVANISHFGFNLCQMEEPSSLWKVSAIGRYCFICCGDQLFTSCKFYINFCFGNTTLGVLQQMLIPGLRPEVVPMWCSPWFSVGFPGNREGKLVLRRAEPRLSRSVPKELGAV